MFKMNIVDFLIDNGFFLDRNRARVSVLSGQVFANSIRIDNVDAMIPRKAFVEVIGPSSEYASTDGNKLEDALNTLGISMIGKYAIDMYAYHGSMSQALITNGASGVYTFYNDERAINKPLINLNNCKALNVSNLSDEEIIGTLSSISPMAQFAILHSKNTQLKNFIPYFRHIVAYGDILWHIKVINEIDSRIIRKLGIASQKSYFLAIRSIINKINSYQGMAVNNIYPSKYITKDNLPEIFIHILTGKNIIPFEISDDYIYETLNIATRKHNE